MTPHETTPPAPGERQQKVALYGDAAFAQGYFRRASLSPTGQMITQEEHAILRGLLPAGTGGRAIDVGTGNGRLLPVLRALGYEPLGVDLSHSMLVADAVLAERRVRGDAQRLPFASDSVEGVLAHRLLYHFQDYAPLLAEFARVTRPGGWICADILAWTPSGLARKLGLRSGRLVRPIQLADVERTAARLGLRVTRREGAFALNPATAAVLPLWLARALARATSLPWVPRVKVYLLFEKPCVGEATRS